MALSDWISGSTISAPPSNRVQFYDWKRQAPQFCPRCVEGILRDVPDGKACSTCPWHAVIRESIRDSQRHGYVEAKAYYDINALDDREGVSTRVFFRARRRFCAT